MTGATDYVSDGQRVIALENGHELMASITGSGCMATTVVGCFSAGMIILLFFLFFFLSSARSFETNISPHQWKILTSYWQPSRRKEHSNFSMTPQLNLKLADH